MSLLLLLLLLFFLLLLLLWLLWLLWLLLLLVVVVVVDDDDDDDDDDVMTIMKIMSIMIDAHDARQTGSHTLASKQEWHKTLLFKFTKSPKIFFRNSDVSHRKSQKLKMQLKSDQMFLSYHLEAQGHVRSSRSFLQGSKSPKIPKRKVHSEISDMWSFHELTTSFQKSVHLQYNNCWLVVSTHLQNISQKWESSPNRGWT